MSAQPSHGTVLVTGGLGYIGSHAVVALEAAGHRTVIIDNLTNSERTVLPRLERLCGRAVPFLGGDVRDGEFVEHALRRHDVVACVHFAGLKSVAASVEQPLTYYDVNVGGTVALLAAMRRAGTRRLIFSSSATVYGTPGRVPIPETAATVPTNPYGRSKLTAETVIDDECAARPELAAMSLRYFNPAGAHASGLIGERPRGRPDNLMPYVSQVAAGLRPHVDVFGIDYPTPDGTGVRDYVHVVDLAEAHVRALETLPHTGGHARLNLGTGRGYSVLELIHAYQRATGRRVPYAMAPRRAGDIAECFADASLAEALLDWKAGLSLEDMCRDAARFESAMADGGESMRIHQRHPSAARPESATQRTG